MAWNGVSAWRVQKKIPCRMRGRGPEKDECIYLVTAAIAHIAADVGVDLVCTAEIVNNRRGLNVSTHVVTPFYGTKS